MNENKRKISFFNVLVIIASVLISAYLVYSVADGSLKGRNKAYLKNEVSNQYELYRTEYLKEKKDDKKVKEEKERFLKMYSRGYNLEIDLKPAYSINTLKSDKDLKVIVDFYKVRSLKNSKDTGLLVFTDTYNFKTSNTKTFEGDSFGSIHDYHDNDALIIAIYNKEKTINQITNLLQPQSPFIIPKINNIQQISITSAKLQTYVDNKGTKTLQDSSKWYLTVPKTEFTGYIGDKTLAEGNENTIKDNIETINKDGSNFVVYENYYKDLNNHNTNVVLTIIGVVILVLILLYFIIAHKYVKPILIKKFAKNKNVQKVAEQQQEEEKNVIDADFEDIDKK